MFNVFPLLHKSLRHYLAFYLSSVLLFSSSQQADRASFNWAERRFVPAPRLVLSPPVHWRLWRDDGAYHWQIISFSIRTEKQTGRGKIRVTNHSQISLLIHTYHRDTHTYTHSSRMCRSKGREVFSHTRPEPHPTHTAIKTWRVYLYIQLFI